MQPAKYAAVHESRTAEDRRTAAELTARLTKLRNEHKDSAARVASEVSQPAVANVEETTPQSSPKQKQPWPVKVSFLTSVSHAALTWSSRAACYGSLLSFSVALDPGLPCETGETAETLMIASRAIPNNAVLPVMTQHSTILCDLLSCDSWSPASGHAPGSYMHAQPFACQL